MLGPHLFIFAAQFASLAQFERLAQGIERAAPLPPIGERPAKD